MQILFSVRLYRTGLKVKFVTNTTKESKRVLLDRLLKIGFSIKEDQVFTSLTAARNLIDKRKLSPLLLIDDKALEEFKGTIFFFPYKFGCFLNLSWCQLIWMLGGHSRIIFTRLFTQNIFEQHHKKRCLLTWGELRLWLAYTLAQSDQRLLLCIWGIYQSFAINRVMNEGCYETEQLLWKIITFIWCT